LTKKQRFATAVNEHSISTPRPCGLNKPAGMVGCLSKEYPAAIQQAGINGEDIKGVGLTGQMHDWDDGRSR
jgi:sugar (pentulose or hexulose) kinase